MIERTLKQALLERTGTYPAVAVTGPRQSGKTTLVRSALPDHEYVSCEDPDVRRFALEDPRSFLKAHEGPVVLDEVQRVPDLLSYLQTTMDIEGGRGRYVLTGSSNFALLESVSQSLAGRVAMLTLLPFSLSELDEGGKSGGSLEDMLFTGSYPPIHDRGMPPGRWCADYVDTYLERDVRRIVNVGNLDAFALFLRLCAARSGQILNLAALGNDCGISHNTARSWLSVLRAGYILDLVQPYMANIRKRLIKTPKLYFLDTGLLCYLLEIDSPRDMMVHSARGAVFETWVYSELVKSAVHEGRPARIRMFRDYSGHEVDFILGPAGSPVALEAKSGRTVTHDFFKGTDFWRSLDVEGSSKPIVVYGGDETQRRERATVLSWRDIGEAAPVCLTR